MASLGYWAPTSAVRFTAAQRKAILAAYNDAALIPWFESIALDYLARRKAPAFTIGMRRKVLADLRATAAATSARLGRIAADHPVGADVATAYFKAYGRTFDLDALRRMMEEFLLACHIAEAAAQGADDRAGMDTREMALRQLGRAIVAVLGANAAERIEPANRRAVAARILGSIVRAVGETLEKPERYVGAGLAPLARRNLDRSTGVADSAIRGEARKVNVNVARGEAGAPRFELATAWQAPKAARVKGVKPAK